MTDQQTASEAALHAVRHAQQMEMAGDGETAESYWRRAERRYVDAGLDERWFDPISLMQFTDENPPKMKPRWLCPSATVELSYDPRGDVTGIVVDAESLVDVEP